MKKPVFGVLGLLLLGFAACTPPTAGGEYGQLKPDGKLDEFTANACITPGDQPGWQDWGPNNTIQKLCVFADAQRIYVGAEYKVEDNNGFLIYGYHGEGSDARNMNFGGWPRNVTFAEDVPRPTFFLANSGGKSDVAEFWTIANPQKENKTQALRDAKGGVWVTPSTQDSPVVMEAVIPRSFFGQNLSGKMGFVAVLVGGDDWGGCCVLPATGNTVQGSDQSNRIDIGSYYTIDLP